MRGDGPCPGGRDGLDVHPAFTADAGRLRRVSEFVAHAVPAEAASARALRGQYRNAPIPTMTA